MYVEYLRFFVYQVHFLRSFLPRPHTDRFPDDILKKIRWNRIHDSYEKNATGMENTGIRRIPARIGNQRATEIKKKEKRYTLSKMKVLMSGVQTAAERVEVWQHLVQRGSWTVGNTVRLTRV